jgi:hypothetical protein
MTDLRGKQLSEIVRISRHYQRSIRIDADIGREDALDGYIRHGTVSTVLESMAKQVLESRQRAFTWTGPYGGGKSSLAVVLASALAPEKKLRSMARSILGTPQLHSFEKAFPAKNGWLVVPVVGKRGSVIQEIAKALRKARGQGLDSRKALASSVISDLCSAADNDGMGGTILILDELGKFLEASALGTGDDIYFFQELAEAAARSENPLVVVGILHQSFGQYAVRLGIDTRDDWAKIQGRYSDIPLVAASDEVVELIGRAIDANDRPAWSIDAAETIAESIKARRPAVGNGFGHALALCWPLHPVMAALLGPISKRQFGQNERSTFGFLSSSEPHGFKTYIQATAAQDATWYLPSDYWDYLKANLEQAILASNDGHRWAQAAEAVERAEAKSDDPLHVALIKSIAVLDLFKDGSGLAAEPKVLGSIFTGHPIARVEDALEDLAKWRVALFKKHTGAWSVFEGSDFDIDQAVSQARAAMPGTDFDLLTSLSSLYPVIAKRHYHETGTFRWMNVALCRLAEAQRTAEAFKPKNGEFGLLFLALPGRGVSEKAAKRLCAEQSRSEPWPVVIGLPANHARIDDLGAELLALQSVQTRHELQGDSVARREVFARAGLVRASLEEQLGAALTNASWFAGDIELDASTRLAPIASALADTIYADAPKLWSELVNRDSLSSNSVKARRELLYRMLERENEPNLGIDGYPAERGLYETLLRSTGLHRQDADGNWRFLPPDENNAIPFTALWARTRKLFKDSGSRVEAAEIHKLWAAPPFGLREGAMPIVFTAFMLAHKGNVATYKDGVFVPRITDADIDEYLQDEKRFSLRWVTIDDEKKRILGGIAEILAEVGAVSTANDPLEAARGLVAMVLGLSAWTQRTSTLTTEAKAVRDTLLKASDPHKVLFVDLAAVLGTSDGDEYVRSLRDPVEELWNAYDSLLRRIESRMLEALDAPLNDLSRLRSRAETLASITGDLRQDAFAARLAKHDGSQESIEGILSLAANKPPRDWNDRDINSALLEIARFALRFRQSEALVAVQGRKPSSEAFAVVVGAGSQIRTFSREFDIPERHREKVENLADELASRLRSEGLSTEVLMAALGRACMRLAQDGKDQDNG